MEAGIYYSMNRRRGFNTRGVLLWGLPFVIALFALALLLVSQRFEAAAAWYAANIFPVFPHTLGRLFGWLPFSVFEPLLFMSPIAVIAVLVRFKVAGVRYLLYAVSLLFLMFVLTTGINYNRESFAGHVGISVQESAFEELVALYVLLAERAHEVSERVEVDADGHFVLQREGLHRAAAQSMHDLHELYGGLGTYFPRAKAPLTSRLILSNFRIAGFFSPWTMEAHYNGDMPGQSIPFTIAHELAHFTGYMREDEAHFIAYLAGRHSGVACLEYSSVYIALNYVLNALRRNMGQDEYNELFALLPEQVVRDFAVSRAYWQAFEGAAADFQERVNDAYLRMNMQADGVQSYGRMVDLLLAYYRANGGCASSPRRYCR